MYLNAGMINDLTNLIMLRRFKISGSEMFGADAFEYLPLSTFQIQNEIHPNKFDQFKIRNLSDK